MDFGWIISCWYAIILQNVDHNVILHSQNVDSQTFLSRKMLILCKKGSSGGYYAEKKNYAKPDKLEKKHF